VSSNDSKGTAWLVGAVCVALGLVFYFCARVTPANLLTIIAAGFYLLSTLFRPAQAYFTHLRAHLGTMLREATFPPDDVKEPKRLVGDQGRRLKTLEERLVRIDGRTDGLENRLVTRTDQIETRLTARADAAGQQLRTRAEATSQQVQALGRRFEEAIDTFSDNQELVTGLRAFLRLLRAEQA
jgi:hypothetical protein